MHQGLKAPKLAQSAGVLVDLEDPAHPLTLLTNLRHRMLRIDLDLEKQLLDNSVSLKALVSVPTRAVNRFLKDSIRFDHPAGLSERGAEAR